MLNTLVLISHIGAGTIGLTSGAAALFVRKGSDRHKAAGKVFIISMLIVSAIGAYLGYVKDSIIDLIVGILVIYVIATAWMTIVRKEGETGLFEKAALVFVLTIAASSLIIGLNTAENKASEFYRGTVFALSFAAGDTHAILRGGLSGAHRILRHVWRMFFAMLITTIAVFVGQQQAFPESIQGSLILGVPVFTVFGLMVFWILFVTFTKRFKKTHNA